MLKYKLNDECINCINASIGIFLVVTNHRLSLKVVASFPTYENAIKGWQVTSVYTIK